MDLSGKRKLGRSKRRFMDAVREDMAVVEMTEEEAEDMTKWRWKSSVVIPDRRSQTTKNKKKKRGKNEEEQELRLSPYCKLSPSLESRHIYFEPNLEHAWSK